ncbi:hypothetical protein YC2023_110884 [Brassica napus]
MTEFPSTTEITVTSSLLLFSYMGRCSSHIQGRIAQAIRFKRSFLAKQRENKLMSKPTSFQLLGFIM